MGRSVRRHPIVPRCSAVVGLQWGDEGKGKIVDLLTPEHDAVVRYNGGANAGHTVAVAGQRYALHLVPSGILTPGKKAVIANGVVVDPEALLGEVAGLQARGVDMSGLVVSDRAHVVFPYHKEEDTLREALLAASGEDETDSPRRPGNTGGLGTTRRGIGPAYADKHQRATAVRIGDLLRPDRLREKLQHICNVKGRTLPRLASGPTDGLHVHVDPERLFETAADWGRRLKPYVTDTFYLLHEMLDRSQSLLFEGANASLLDVDHGTFPYVTSSACTALGIGQGTGVSERRLARVIGVMKAYSTRVGAGPFPTELRDGVGDRIRERGREYGTTTGRPRRCGWLDLVAVRYSATLNAASSIALTLLDVLGGFEEINVCTAYVSDSAPAGGDRFLPDAHTLATAEPVYQTLPGFPDFAAAARPPTTRAELPDAARRYLDFIEDYVGLPIDLVGVGPERHQTLRA